MLQNLHYIPLIGVFICVFLTIVYFKIRPRYAYKVNCWFCNKNTHVPYGNTNCWDCPFCDQYNGFDKEGGYNKPIPAQHIENLNHPINAVIEGGHSEFKNELCKKCTRNQSLKIKQLAKFQPHFESTYDEEVEAFSKHLDNVYRLCEYCDDVLQAKLSKENCNLQKNILDHQLNESFDQETVLNRSIYHSKLQSLSSLILRSLTIIASVLLFICNLHILQEDCGTILIPFKSAKKPLYNILRHYSNSMSSFIPIFGLFATVIAVFNSGKYRLQKTDGLTSFAWVFVLLSHNQPIHWLLAKEDVLVLRPLMAAAVFVLTVICTTCRKYTFIRSIKGILIEKKTRPSPAGKVRSMNGSFDGSTWDDALSSVSQQTCRRCSSQIDTTSAFTPIIPPQSSQVKNLPSDFFNMRISASQSLCNTPLPTTSSKSSVRHRNKPLLNPSKLDLINQLDYSKPYSRSSWVDGGFWDNNFTRPHVHNNLSSRQSVFSGPIFEDRFSAKSEPVFTSRHSSLFQKNMLNASSVNNVSAKLAKKSEEKTSEYGSDSQLSFASFRPFQNQ